MSDKGFATDVLAPSAVGQPLIISWPITRTADLVGRHPLPWAFVFAGIQVAIGVGLLARRTARFALSASIVWAVSAWWIGEGFGMLPAGTASPLTGGPGPVILYGLVAMLAWVPAGAAENGSISSRMARWVWLALWAAGTVMWALPANRAPGAIHDAVSAAADGEPGWLAGFLRQVADLVDGRGAGLAVGLAVLSLIVGVGVFTRMRLMAVALGVVITLAYWVFGQAFGGLLTGQGTDPGTGPLLLLVAAVLVSRPRRGERRPEGTTLICLA